MATDPGTRSPGSLYLRYNVGIDQHICAVKYINGVDIQALTPARADAVALATKLKDCLPLNNSSIVAWGLKDANGSPAYEEVFTTPYGGAKNGAGQMYASLTLTIPGLGVPTTVGGAKGKTRFVWFCGGAYLAPIRSKLYTPIPAEINAVIELLHSNLRYFADFYGQHAEPKARVTVEYNARIQKSLGT